MTPQEVEAIFDAVWLGLQGRYDALKYHFKMKTPKNISNGVFYRLSMNDSLTKTDLIRLFILHTLIHNEYKKNLRISDQEILEYKQRLSNPSLYLNLELKSLTISKLKQLITETEFGSPLAQQTLGGKIHTITLLQICAITKCNSTWTWGGWKAISDKFDKAIQYMQFTKDEQIKLTKLFTE
jgi:hypothetical protein